MPPSWGPLLALVLLSTLLATPSAALGIVKQLIRNNLAGEAINFVTQHWDFDPDVAERRRPEFYAQHGYRAEKLIERLGLGDDGHMDYRLHEQLARDSGGYRGS